MRLRTRENKKKMILLLKVSSIINMVKITFLILISSSLILSLNFKNTALKELLNDDELYFDKSIPEYATVLTPNDFINGAQLDAQIGDDDSYMWDNEAIYSNDKFEGDIIGINASTINAFINGGVDPNSKDTHRNAIKNKHQLWRNGRIPYVLSSQYSSHSRSVIANSMEEYNKHTCIRWVPKENSDTDYVYIMPDRGCYSMVGRMGNRQVLSLGSGCIQKGIIIHEMMHAVGFFHEQSRTDRDDFITIFWNNIMNGMSNQFEKYGQGVISALGTTYDYGSIMHYGSTAFSKNGQPTMLPKKNGAKIGQRDGFSKVDIFKINTLYQCDDKLVGTIKPTTTISTTIKMNSSPKPITPQPITPPSPSPPPLPTECKNKRPDCNILAAQGWCNINAPWMKDNCPESCGYCGTLPQKPEEICEDLRVDCNKLVTARYCITSEHFMRTYCQKSCGFCTPKNITKKPIQTTSPGIVPIISITSTTLTPLPITPSTTISTSIPSTTTKRSATISTTKMICINRKHFCTQWKASGFCEGIFLSYMRKNCPKACGYC
uniref:Metalloendopeptidase n=2 Tax=Strongyloides stercoralis TaxID=6248 RepID=A0AAF5DK57_STRER